MRILLLLFIVMPIAEMWVLISVGQQIGAPATIGLVLLTAVIGIALLRYQGAMTLLKAREKMGSGQLPAREMADGLFFAIGGALLLTPGFVTDAVGFACLTPGIRTVLISFFTRHLFPVGAQDSRAHFFGTLNTKENDSGQGNEFSKAYRSEQKVNDESAIEGDYERHKD